MDRKRIGKRSIAVLVAIALMVGAAFSLQTTQSEYKQGAYESVDLDVSPGDILIGNNDNTHDPVAYYRLDGSGGTVSDYSDNGNDGSTSGGVTTGATGIYGSNAFSFDGTDDYIDVTSFSYQDQGTVSAWYNIDSISSGRKYIFSNAGGSDRVYLYSDSGDLEVSLGETDGIDTGHNITGGEWGQVALVWNSGNYEVYVEGDLIDSGTYSGTVSNSYNSYIGSLDGTQQYWPGDIDNVRIYDESLTSDQVQQLYRSTSRWNSQILDSQREETEWRHVDWNGSTPAGTDVKVRALATEGFVTLDGFGPVENTYLTNWVNEGSNYDYLDFRTSFPGLLNVSMRGLDFNSSQQTPELWYSFEGVNDTVKDFSSNDVDGFLDSAERSPGYSGKGVSFDGNEYFTVSGSGDSMTNPAGTFTMEMWVHPDNLTANAQTLVDKQNEFQLNLENNGEIWFRIYDQNNQGAGNISEDGWTHIAVEWDSGNSITTFVDGTQVDTHSISNVKSQTSNPVYFGQASDGTKGFNGSIDEVRVFRNQTGIQFLTGIGNFTDPSRSSGKTTNQLTKDFFQVRYRPGNTQPYTVDLTRIGQEAEWSQWVGNGERFNVKNSSHAIYQMNLSTTDSTQSPVVESSRMRSVIPDQLNLPGTGGNIGSVESFYTDELVIDLSINETNISTTDPVQADMTFWNTREYCSYNQSSGFCEQIDSNEIVLQDTRFMANNHPLRPEIDRALNGSTKADYSYAFTAPPSIWVDWNFHTQQIYNVGGEEKKTNSDTVIDYYGFEKADQRESCSYSIECSDGLYCGDTTGDDSVDTCLSEDKSLQGNVCEDLGAGIQERVSGGGTCEIASSGMENENQLEGFNCKTSTDCVTDYCYDGNGDGQKTCQTGPNSGSSDGMKSTSRAGDADSCYFAGETYSEGSSESIFGVSNTCNNGVWERDVQAKMNYSSVEEGETLEIDYNVFNFKDGYQYQDGYISRLDSNDVQLQQIKIGIEDQVYTRSLTETVNGLRNKSGTVTIDVPELEYTDDLTAVTYLEYTHGGNTYTIAGTPLQGGNHSERLDSGSCRKGYQIDDQYYCLYDAQEQPYGDGTIVTSSGQAGNLCEERTSSNLEKRVTNGGSCEPAQAGAENNNLPDGYQCETKEDCISNYCRDAGSGAKTCQSNPATGTNTGVKAGPQSCDDSSCFYGGKCYEEGKQLNSFELQSSMTCEAGDWDTNNDNISFELDVPDQSIEDTLSVDLKVANPYEYCEWDREVCEIVESNFVQLDNITFSIKDYEPVTYNLDKTMEGEAYETYNIDIDVPAMDYTDSSRMRAVMHYQDRDGTMKQSVVPMVTRGNTWLEKSSGESCTYGYQTAFGLYCKFDQGQDVVDETTGTVVSSSSDAGDLCRSEGGATTERVSTSGSCELAGPSAEGQNLPDGYQCKKQSDCISSYCYDKDEDGVKTCEPTKANGTENGQEITDESDCAPNSCTVRGECYDPGATVEFENQTFTCESDDQVEPDEEVLQNITESQEIEEQGRDMDAKLKNITLGVTPNTTTFVKGQPVKFEYFIRNKERFCEENQTTGECFKEESNRKDMNEIRTWFNKKMTYVDSDIYVYGGERKESTFTVNVPDTEGYHDFRAVVQYTNQRTGERDSVSSGPHFDQMFNRSSAGDSCRYSLECTTGLYCGDTNGDSTPDTCINEDQSIQGNVCEYYGANGQERVSGDGACKLSAPGFENDNVPEGGVCETSADCVTDFCQDANGDGQKTCETGPAADSATGTKAASDSCGSGQCFYAGQCYEHGTEKDINEDSTTSVCENGAWTDPVNVEMYFPTGFEDGEQINVDYRVMNTLGECNQATGFCYEGRNSVEIDEIVVNFAGIRKVIDINQDLRPQREIDSSFQFNIPELNHTEIHNARAFVHYNDTDGSQEVSSSSPVIRGLTYGGVTAGACESGAEAAHGYFCEYSSQNDPAGSGEIVNSSTNAGNICKKANLTNVEHRVTTSGACMPSDEGEGNFNLPNGEECEISADCISSYCYDGDGDGQKTCQGSATPGSASGVEAGPDSGDSDTCYFAGKAYDPGTGLDIMGEGITQTCTNGKWDKDVGAAVEYSSVGDDRSIDITYNVFNFKNGYDHNKGYLDRIESNVIQLEEIRVDLAGEHYEKNIGGTISGEKNATGTVTVDVPPLTARDNYDVRTYVVYSHEGTNYSVVASPVKGGQFYEGLTSGSCRKGQQTADGYFCNYDSQQQPYGEGIVVSSSTQSGNLCETGKAVSVEERVSTSGACKTAELSGEGNNLPDGYQCETKEDCVSNYCRDAGSGNKTCQSNPATGTNTGVKAGPQSCEASSCHLNGKCYEEGKQLETYDLNTPATCENGKWNFDKNEMFKLEFPDQPVEGTVPVDVTFHNPYEYCNWEADVCAVAEENIITVENITFSMTDREPFTRDIGEDIPGEGVYNQTVDVSFPQMNDTYAPELRGVVTYTINDTQHQIATSLIARENARQRLGTGNACSDGYQPDEGLFCEFDDFNRSQLDLSTGEVVLSSSQTGDLCRSGGAATEERINTEGSCELAGPGTENSNLPDGYQCKKQSDCISSYCYDKDEDGVKTCQPTKANGTEDGQEITADSDCAPNSCTVRGRCYDPGATVEFEDQTFTCESDEEVEPDEEIDQNVSTPQVIEDNASSINAIQREIAFGVYPNTTTFEEGSTVTFDYVVWNPREYCAEDDTTGICTRIDSNMVETEQIKAWFGQEPQRFDSNIAMYGEERKTGSFQAFVPERIGHRDFRSELQYGDLTFGDTRPVSSRPFFEPLFNRSGEGGSCSFNTDCQTGLYCGDTTGDAQPDTCIQQDSSYAGNICEDRGSMEERVDTGGACEFAQPGFENSNLKEGMTCRTSQDCVTTYCYDSNDDGTKTCQTDRTSGASDGVETTIDSVGLNSCFFAGETYPSGTSKDVNADSDTEECSNGLWVEEIKFDAQMDYGFTDGDTVNLDYDVHNPRKGCDRSSGFCERQQQRSISLEKIVINTAGQRMEKSISGTVYPERNVSGSVSFDIPVVNHTDVMNTRVFLHIDDRGTTDIFAAKPVVRGTPFQNRDSGSCSSAYHLAPDVFCEYDTQEEPSSNGEIVSTGFEPGNICAESQPSNAEKRVTTSGTCEPAADGAENRNLPFGYECTTEQDCITDYCYDMGSSIKTCQSTPENGTSNGVLAARQSHSSTACQYGEQVYQEGTTVNIFGQDATCSQGRWNYQDDEFGFKAEIPDQVEPGQSLEMNYSFFNALQYCTYEGNDERCEVIEENKVRLDSVKIEFRSETTTLNLDHVIAGGERHDDSVSFTVPAFDYTENIPITMKVVGNRTYDDGSTVEFVQKTDDVIRGSDWKRKTSGLCRNGFKTDSGYYCLYNNQTDVKFGEGDVRQTSEAAGEICESPQPTTKLERVSTSGSCEPAQAGAQNQNLLDGYQCQNQADCISSYCYDEDMDGTKTCQPDPSNGSASGEKISEESDCTTPSCHIRGYCYEHGASLQYKDQMMYCDDGELRSEEPTNVPEPGEILEDVAAEYRDFSFEIMDTVVGPNTLDVAFNFTNRESFPITLESRYIVSGFGVEKDMDTDVNLEPNESEQFNITDVEKPINGVQLFYSEARITNATQGVNTYVTSNTTCYVAEWNGFQETCIRDDPEIRDVSFTDFSQSHRFSVEIEGYDLNGADNVTTCRIYAEEEDKEESITVYGDIDTTVGDSSELSCTYDNINASINEFDPTDHIKIIATLIDGTGKTGMEVTSHEIPNRAPTHNDPIITPDPALSGDDLVVNPQNVDDIEGDQVSLEYNWTVNGEPTGYQTEKLGSGNYSVDDFVTAYVTPSDQWDVGEERSDTLQIQPSLVEITSINFDNATEEEAFNTSAIIEGSDPEGINTCNINATDPDGNLHQFTGDIDSSFGNGGQVSCNYSRIDTKIEGFEAGEEITIDYYIEDVNGGSDTGTSYNVIPTVSVNPVVGNLTFTNYSDSHSFNISADVGADNISEFNKCEVYADDGDEQHLFSAVLNTSYGGTNDAECHYSNINNSISGFDALEEIDIKVNATTGSETANATGSNVIPNRAPNMTAPAITPISPEVDDDLTGTPQDVIDAEDDSVTINYTWYVSGTEQSTGIISPTDQTVLESDNFDGDDTVTLEMTAQDFWSIGDTNSTSINFKNDPPTIEDVFTDPLNPKDGDTITLNANVTDLQGDKVLWTNFTVVHENGTTLVENVNGTQDGKTWTSPEFSVEDEVIYNWTVNTTDYENRSGKTGVLFTTNKEPWIKEITISKVLGRHAFDVEAVVEDPSGGADISVCEVEAWDGEGNKVNGTGSLDSSYGVKNEALCTYSDINASTSGFDVGELIDFNVTIEDSVGQTAENTSSGTIQNTAPTVSLLSPEEDGSANKPVTFSWSTSDEENDPLESRLVIAENSDLSNVVVNMTMTNESIDISDLSEQETYYWKVRVDDSYNSVESDISKFIVVEEIKEVTISLTGDYSEVTAGGRTISEGTYTDLEYPYIAMQDDVNVEGLIGYGGMQNASYMIQDGNDTISVTQRFNGKRVLVTGFEGTTGDIDIRENEVQNNELFSLPLPSFSGTIPEQSVISSTLSYTDIDIVGENRTIAPGPGTDLMIRNRGVEDGRVKVELYTN